MGKQRGLLTLSMEGEQLRDESRSARVPRDVRRDGTSSEYGKHVLEPVWVLRVLL